jgi:AbrB family looped-hinge helix DNA binding protein
MPVKGMAKSKVTDKHQLTVPKEVREKVGMRAGEEVIVEARERGEIVIRRLKRVKQPLEILVGKKPVFERPVAIDELEERMGR